MRPRLDRSVIGNGQGDGERADLGGCGRIVIGGLLLVFGSKKG